MESLRALIASVLLLSVSLGAIALTECAADRVEQLLHENETQTVTPNQLRHNYGL